MFGLIGRDRLQGAVLDEFEHLVARLKATWLTEHNEDGTHRTVDGALTQVPVGFGGEWYSDTAPTGWVFQRGQQLSRVDYKALFDAIGTTFGAGDGSTTFNVPDKQQRFALGKAAAGTGSSLAGTGGTIDAAPALTGSTAAEASHTHPVNPPLTNLSFDSIEVDRNLDGLTSIVPRSTDTPVTDIAEFTSGAGSSHSHGAGTLAVAASNPPYLVVNYIIFTGRS